MLALRQLILFVIPCILLNAAAALEESTIKVFRSKSNSPDEFFVSGGRLINTINVSVIDITFCIRFNYKRQNALMVIEDWRISDVDFANVFSLMWLGAWYPLTFFGFGWPREKRSYRSWVMRDPDYPEYSWTFNKWCHVCLAYEKTTGSFRVILDGKTTNVNTKDPEFNQVSIPTDFLSRVFIARCNADWDWCTSPAGQMVSDFNVWSRALTVQEMQDWTTCRSMLKGDVVDWNTAMFDLANMTVETQSVSYICIPPRPGHVLFPERRNFSNLVEFCQKMRGVVSVVQDNVTQLALSEEITNNSAICGYDYWAGWWDEPKEGHFSHAVTGKELTLAMYSPWNLGEPNGDTLENCAVVQSFERANTWNDAACTWSACGFCEMDRYPDLQIRGLCPFTQFDRKYSWTRAIVNNRYSFRGYALSVLYWDSNNTEWKLELLSNKQVFATVSTSAGEYPLGTHEWDIFRDPCYPNNETKVLLNINACNSTEFNCVNGHCVSMDQRCDGKVDCPDKTDELGCTIFTTDASYLKDVPPAPPAKEGDSLHVNISVDILSILDINEVDNLINMQLQLRLTWFDRRLTMFDLKMDNDLNTLTPAFRNALWIPEVVFHNTQDKIESLNDEKAFATITRLGSFAMSARDKLENFYEFRGAENPISISRVYNAEFLCQFNMATFPFDTQVCSIVIIMKGNTAKFITMRRDVLNYLGPIDLTQYFVKGTNMTDDFQANDDNDVTAVKIDVVFGRRILGTMLTTYLPTILICIVSFSTNYFKAFFFEANVSVNLTCLLVLTTLYISVVTSMTKTSYIKMIDVWFIFNLCIPFAEVLLHTYIDSLREEENREINHHGKQALKQPETNNEETKTKKKKKKDKSFVVNRVGAVNYDHDLVAREDNVEVTARKKLYDNIERANRNEIKIRIGMAIVMYGLPCLFTVFIVAYFGAGYYYYYSVTA